MPKRKAVVITVSDSAYKGDRVDQSGPMLASLLQSSDFDVVDNVIVPDVRQMIVSALEGHSATPDIHLVATTGGTGLGPRDITPEATLDVIERRIPGMSEAMRAESLKKTPYAMTSRQVVGTRRRTLIINFPGSTKAVAECFDVVKPVLHHVIDLIRGKTEHDTEL